MAATIVPQRKLEIAPFRAEILDKSAFFMFPAPSRTDELPSHVEWYNIQVAGHITQVKNGKQEIGFLKNKMNRNQILKPMLDGSRGVCEKNFYERTFTNPRPSHKIFRDLVPAYTGTQKIMYKGNEYELLELEDITANFQTPAVMDIKIGRTTFDPSASQEKRDRETNKYPHQYDIGFRLLGYKVESSSGPLASMKREYASQLRPGDIYGALEAFFSHAPSHSKVNILDQILVQLEYILHAMKTSELHFYSSSVLIVYEADSSANWGARMKLIDFGHVHDANGKYQEDFAYGIRKLYANIECIKNSL